MINPFEHGFQEHDKFESFYEQREASYLKSVKGEENYENTLENFRNNIPPVEPQLDRVDGYKAEAEL